MQKLKCPKCKKSDRLFGGLDGHSCERCEITYADAYGREILGWQTVGFFFPKLKPILGNQKYSNIIKENNYEGKAMEPYFKDYE